MDEIRKIGILGIGGVGSLIASRLCLTKHKLFCLGSDKSNIHIRKNGIEIKSNLYGKSINYPNLNDEIDNLDFLFLTVKGINLISSLKSHENLFNKNTIIISLLNGIGYKKLIRENFNLNTIIGSIGSLEVFLDKDRIAIHKSIIKPKIEFASTDKSLNKEISFIKNLLIEVGIDSEIKDDENFVIWKKLSRLMAISTITSMYDLSVGEARTKNFSRNIMLKLIDEIYLITSYLEVKITPNEIMDSIKLLPYDLMTSMQRDLKSKKPSEIDFILKAPLKFGENIGLNLPVMKYCYEFLVNKIEKGVGDE